MSGTFSMTILVVVIVGCAAGCFWYWTKLRAHSDKTAKSSSANEGGKQEPLLNPESTISDKPLVVDRNELSELGARKQSSNEEQAGTDKKLEEEESQAQEKPVEENKPTYIPPLNEPEPFEQVPEVEETDEEGLPKLDPFLCETIRINFRNPIAGSELMQKIRSLHDIEPASLIQTLGYESGQKKWYPIDAIGVFSSVVLLVQLASRKGSFSEVSISQLIQLTQRLEMALDGTSDIKDSQELTQKAQKLAGLIRQFGVQITLLLKPQAPIDIDKYGKVCSDLGFRRKNSRQYEKLGEAVIDEDGKHLGNRKGAIETKWFNESNIAISLNVPLIAPENEPLKLFMTACNAFAAAFDAQIFDGSGRSISASTLNMVKQELDAFYKKMSEGEVEPGSLRAHKLLD